MFKFLKSLLKSSFAICTGIPLFCAVCCAAVATTFAVIKIASTNIITLPFGKDSQTSKNIKAKADPTFDAVINFFKGGASYCLNSYTAVVRDLKDSATSGISNLGYARTPIDSESPEKLIATGKTDQKTTRNSMLNLLTKIGNEGTKKDNSTEFNAIAPEKNQERVTEKIPETLTPNSILAEQTPTLPTKEAAKTTKEMKPSSTPSSPRKAQPAWNEEQFKKAKSAA